MQGIFNSSIKKIAGTMLLLTILIQLSSCAKTDREKQLYQLIEQGVELAEGHNIRGLMELTQDSFTAGPGDRSKQEVRRILFVAFKRFGEFNIHYPKPSIRVSPDENSAIVKMNFLMASKESLFPELEQLYEDASAWIETVDKRADIYTLSIELEYESDSWLINKARITGFGRPHGRL